VINCGTQTQSTQASLKTLPNQHGITPTLNTIPFHRNIYQRALSHDMNPYAATKAAFDNRVSLTG